MVGQKREGINPRVWKDTGKRLNDRKLFKSILGHYAIEEDGMYLRPLSKEEKAKGVNHVD